MTDTPGLRERKRQQTRRRIVDAATELVEKRGFDAVTVEDICASAEISRRTFFNYMDSKDEAVLGAFPLTLDAERAERLVETPSDNLVADVLTELAAAMTNIEDDSDMEFRRTIRDRRMRILSAEPTLGLIKYYRFRDLASFLHKLVLDHLTRHDADRREPDVPVEEEALAIVGVIRESLILTAHRNRHEPPEPAALRAAWIDSAQLIARLSKGLTW